MGEHKDDERELDPKTPIASLSLGQPRDFYFRHQDARPPKKLNIDKGKNRRWRDISFKLMLDYEVI